MRADIPSGGLKPPTYCLEGSYSFQLNYEGRHFGQGWTRTNETEVSDLQSDAIATMRPTHVLPKVRFELTRLSAPHFECGEATYYSTRAIYSR